MQEIKLPQSKTSSIINDDSAKDDVKKAVSKTTKPMTKTNVSSSTQTVSNSTSVNVQDDGTTDQRPQFKEIVDDDSKVLSASSGQISAQSPIQQTSAPQTPNAAFSDFINDDFEDEIVDDNEFSDLDIENNSNSTLSNASTQQANPQPTSQPIQQSPMSQGMGGWGMPSNNGMGGGMGMGGGDPWADPWADPWGSPTTGMNMGNQAPKLTPQDRVKMIETVFEELLDRKPDTRDINYYKYSTLGEDEIRKQLIEGNEHKQLIKDGREFKQMKVRAEESETRVKMLEGQIKDQVEEFKELTNLLNEKNNYIRKMRERSGSVFRTEGRSTYGTNYAQPVSTPSSAPTSHSDFRSLARNEQYNNNLPSGESYSEPEQAYLDESVELPDPEVVEFQPMGVPTYELEIVSQPHTQVGGSVFTNQSVGSTTQTTTSNSDTDMFSRIKSVFSS